MTPNHKRLYVLLADRPLSRAARRILAALPPQRVSDHLAGQSPGMVYRLFYWRVAGLPLADWSTRAEREKVRELVQRAKGVRT